MSAMLRLLNRGPAELKQRRATLERRHAMDAEEKLIDALANLLVEDALRPPRRLLLRHRPAPYRRKPQLRVVK